MLEVQNLSIHIIKENRNIIEGLSFTLNKGDKFAVIGLEGNGKSTLLKAIYDEGLLPYCEISGLIKTTDKIGYLPQSILEGWSNIRVTDYLLKKAPDEAIDLDDYHRLEQLGPLLQKMRMNPKRVDENEMLDAYSGGELVKLGLVKILMTEPDLLLLDEPTNDLDLDTILFLEDFIKNEERPILFISHDEALLENVSNGIIHLSQIYKKTKPVCDVAKMNYADYKEARKLKLDSAEMIARKQRGDYQAKMERFRQIYSKVEYRQDQAVRNPSQGRLLKKKIHALKSMEKRLLKEKDNFLDIPEREEAIDLFFDEQVELPNGKTVLDFHVKPLTINGRILTESVDLSITGKSKLAIIGKNGSGKSTLLKQIYETLKNRKDLSVGYMSQKYEELLTGEYSALDYILKDINPAFEAKVRKMMGALQFTREEMVNNTRDLSGGQKAKLLLLKMVVNQNNVLLLDEPTRNLSPLSAPVIHELLIRFKGCVICVTHDRRFLETVFDEVYELTDQSLSKIL